MNPLFDIFLQTSEDLKRISDKIKEDNLKNTKYLIYLENEVKELEELSNEKEILDLVKFEGQNNFEYLLKLKKEQEKAKTVEAFEESVYSIKDFLKKIEESPEKSRKKEKEKL